jgi:hypothetical protein
MPIDGIGVELCADIVACWLLVELWLRDVKRWFRRKEASEK